VPHTAVTVKLMDDVKLCAATLTAARKAGKLAQSPKLTLYDAPSLMTS
jgi:hypothetical protein